jgi:hypothetical protein
MKDALLEAKHVGLLMPQREIMVWVWDMPMPVAATVYKFIVIESSEWTLQASLLSDPHEPRTDSIAISRQFGAEAVERRLSHVRPYMPAANRGKRV